MYQNFGLESHDIIKKLNIFYILIFTFILFSREVFENYGCAQKKFEIVRGEFCNTVGHKKHERVSKCCESSDFCNDHLELQLQGTEKVTKQPGRFYWQLHIHILQKVLYFSSV